ncbi:hypothetical protein ABFV83_02250 [Lacrimispora sp. BS-2]|uniref:Uncharacterized protein n=1 Tax=Lacrimispora sp. BS-2 TaxID=3151850 RepID=A0AAU7PQJ9_9FIRM
MCEDKKSCITINCGCCGTDNGGTPAENVYSTEETVCGTWIDGKPIYRKVIPGKLANDSGNGIVFANVSDLKIDKVVNLYGNLVDGVGNAQIMLQTSLNRTNGLFAAVNVYYYNNNGNIVYHFLNNDGLYSGATANVIIEYTKK